MWGWLSGGATNVTHSEFKKKVGGIGIRSVYPSRESLTGRETMSVIFSVQLPSTMSSGVRDLQQDKSVLLKSTLLKSILLKPILP